MGLKAEDNTTSQVQNILRFAYALRDATGISLQPTHALTTDGLHAVIDSIKLPNPPELLPLLLEAGLNREVATAASKAYQSRSEELRHHIQECIVTACLDIAKLPVAALASSSDSLIPKVLSTFTEIYLQRLGQWKERVMQRIKEVSKTPSKVASRNSCTFNYEYVPLLEHFFEENPFPTHADKVFLADKSNMEYRQIHVWFQNRRNRTKKEGKPLKKKPTCEGITQPLNKSYERMKAHIVDPESQCPRVVSSDRVIEKEVPRCDISKDTFVSPSPSHAFPSVYPPTCPYDPFPCKTSAIYLSKPQWQRVPDGRKPLPLAISIDDLVERFSHLNVRGESRSRGSPKLQSHAATVAITVIPSRAPHPALMVRKYSTSTNAIYPYLSVRAPVSHLKAFRSPASKPLTLVPVSVSPNESGLMKRKTAPLPRFPGRRNTPRDTTPSESSSTSPSSPPLFSMDSDCHSCCSSNVNSSSTPPDIGSVQELSPLFGSPCRSALDSPIHLRACGAVNAISPLSVS